METKIYKKIYGSILYELQEHGFDVQLNKFDNSNQFFYLKNKYLQDFCFVLSVNYYDSVTNETIICLYSIPKYLSSYADTESLKQYCWLRYVFWVNNELCVTKLVSLIKFLKNFKKNKYYYFYNAWIDESAINKKVSKTTLRRFYKQVKNTKAY